MFADPDPIPDPGPVKKNNHQKTWISLNPNPDSFLEVYILYSDQNPVPNPDTSITKKHNKKNLNSYCSVISLFCFKKSESGSII